MNLSKLLAKPPKSKPLTHAEGIALTRLLEELARIGVAPNFREFFSWTIEERACWVVARRLALAPIEVPPKKQDDGASELEALLRQSAASAAKGDA